MGFFSLVAKATHRCWARLLIPGCSDCSDAETDPQGYSAPIPIPSRKLISGTIKWGIVDFSLEHTA